MKVRPLMTLIAIAFIMICQWCAITRCHADEKPQDKEAKLKAMAKDLQELPAVLTAKPLESATGDDEAQKLRKMLYNMRVTKTRDLFKQLARGKGGVDLFMDSMERLMHTGLEVYDSPDDRKKFLKDLEGVCKKVETAIAQDEVLGTAKPEVQESLRRRVREFELEVQIRQATKPK